MHSTIAKAILDGIYEAHKDQWRRTGESIFDPAESVYLCRIVDAIDTINKTDYKYLLQYEYKAWDLIKELGISDPNIITAKKGKIDLLIRNTKEQPLAIVEIKDEYDQEKDLEKDLFRICDLLQNRSREKFPNLFGVFAVGLRRHKEKDVRSHIKESFESMEHKVVRPKIQKKGCICTPYKKDIEYKVLVPPEKGNIVWGASCFVIHSSTI